MGRDKALLQRGGQSQLAFAMSVVTECVDRVFVSTRADQTNDAERAQFDQIVDRYDDMGPVAGILTALEDYPEVDWLVVACDLPNISVETMQLLLRNREGEQAFTAYRSSHDDLPEPLCAVYRSGCTDIVRQFVNDGIHCPRKILIRSDTLLLEQVDPKSLDNVNTPDDLRNSLLQANS
jgi:molybdopterin-guanine dinucleotide biosynthesis protein A